MKKATLLGVLLLALVCGISFAQGPGRQRFRSERENRTRQDNSAEWAKAQAELKKKYPEKIIPFSGERATSSDHRIPQNIITSSWTIEEKRKSK